MKVPRWIKEMFWHNGGKTTLVLAGGLVVAALLTVPAVMDAVEQDHEPLNVIGDYLLPQPVLEDQVAVGGIVHVGPVVKCNLTEDDIVTVVGELHFRRVGDGGTVIPDDDDDDEVPGFKGSGPFLPGCWGDSEENPLRFYANQLPPGVTPGVWIVEGSDTVVRGEETEVEIYFSDQFEVVP